MDESRFDALSRAYAAGSSRRRLVQLLGGLAVGGSLAVLGLRDTVAKRKRKKKHRAVSPPPPPPECSPEPQATTCARGCGNQLNNCQQLVSCPCPSGQFCLPNGTCARPCTDHDQCQDCTGGLNNACSFGASTDGPQVCVAGFERCGDLVPCTDSSGCPQGFACLDPCSGQGGRCGTVSVCP